MKSKLESFKIDPINTIILTSKIIITEIKDDNSYCKKLCIETKREQLTNIESNPIRKLKKTFNRNK